MSTEIPLAAIIDHLATLAKKNDDNTVNLAQRVIALELVVNDAIRSLELDDKHGALACLRLAHVKRMHNWVESGGWYHCGDCGVTAGSGGQTVECPGRKARH